MIKSKIIYNKRCYNIIRQFHNSTYVSDDIAVPFAEKYDHKKVEEGKYKRWRISGYFLPKYETLQNLDEDEVFSMILPPPNITGTLHLGHALTVSLQDTLCRWKRMQGVPVIWMPGTDHAGIATQVVVENHLKMKGLSRTEMGREKFIEAVLEWKKVKIEKINSQLKELGASLDWSKYMFTMDAKQSQAVNEAIIQLFDSGLIYRENTLVNWNCYLKSTLSDIEIDYIKLNGPTKLSLPEYADPVTFGTIIEFACKIEDSNDEMVLATTRPETLFGDVAIMVNPNDSRYTHLEGKMAWHPFRHCYIPIIFDESVKLDFGTGAFKITPAHNKVDFNLAKKHNLPVISVIDESGCLNENCGEFTGMQRFIAKENITNLLAKMNMLRSVKDHELELPVCGRTGDVIEQILKPQWFLKCAELSRNAEQAVRQGDIIIEPLTLKTNYLNWLSDCRDWCLSRQLWWGHRFPLYKCEYGWVAARSADEAKSKVRYVYKKEVTSIEQEEDVLDTWFSSALLPFSAFGWPKVTTDYAMYYPLTLMETGRDILGFWVTRMVMLGLYFTKKPPFKKVVLHGLLCDPQGRKMSKSLGNVIELDDVINGITLEELDNKVRSYHNEGILPETELKRALQFNKKLFPNGIPVCGADALRFTLVSQHFRRPVLKFNAIECRQNAKFCNKIWQASRFVIGWALKLNVKPNTIPKPMYSWQFWILQRLSSTVTSMNLGFECINVARPYYETKLFFMSAFCDIFLELAKPMLKNGTPDEAKATCIVMVHVLETFLRLMAPVMPYITEELYSHLPDCADKLIIDTEYPIMNQYVQWNNSTLDTEMDRVSEIVRCIRALYNIVGKQKTKEKNVVLVSKHTEFLQQYFYVIKTLSGIDSVRCSDTAPVDVYTISDLVDSDTEICIEVLESLKENTSYMERINWKILRLQKDLDDASNILDEMNKAIEKGEEVDTELQEKCTEKVKSLSGKIRRIEEFQKQMAKR